MILMKRTSEFILYFTIIFFSFIKKKQIAAGLFLCRLVLPCFVAGIHVPMGLNTDQMEEREQYNEYSVERNPWTYMSMRDYRSLLWHNQQPLGRNPNTYRSMKDYRNQWMGAPLSSVSPTNAPFDNTYNPSWDNHTNSSWEPRPSQYATPPHPQYASLSQPQPQLPIFPVEQAILDLTKLVGDVVEE